ncbi:MAG: DUF998 domain-containing protein [Methanomassiliicoccaceae archaeon]|nr:DUF998 domain-containing protein [Methanomassiliicoccaceae archaeon]
MKVSSDRSLAFAWVGMIVVAVFVFAWLCAEAIDTQWQFGINKLSELGISSTDASYYFNYGCRIAGILLAIFGIGRAVFGKNAGHYVGGALIFLSGVAFALVGVYTMNDGDIHKYVAIAAAAFLFLAMISMAAGNWAAKKQIFAGVGLVIIFMLIAMAVAYDVAKLESYGIILAMIWLLFESVNMAVSSGKG